MKTPRIINYLLIIPIFSVLTLLNSCGAKKDSSSASSIVENYEGTVYDFKDVDVIPHPTSTDDNASKQVMELELRDKYLQRIMKKFNYPRKAYDKRIQGRVLVEFVIDTEGRVTNVKVIEHVDYDLDKEAVRIIKALPKVKPAYKDGKPVATNYVMPVTFKILRL